MRRLRSILVILLVLLTFTVHFFFHEKTALTNDFTISTKHSTDASRLVLLWTDLFDQIDWHQPSFFHPSTIITCLNRYACRFTRDRQRLSQSSVVGFHLYDLSRSELPQRQFENQTWLFITGESPVNFYYQNPSFLPYVLDQLFDLSFSYKPESPLPIFASTVQPRSSFSDEEQRSNRHSLQLKEKNRPIVWFVSNCVTFSQREKYVEQLQKFISIDIYGQCGRECPDQPRRRCPVDLQKYYFYLSFENSRCQSYITEKFWSIITHPQARLVPIVMGAEENDYARVAPNRSYIHVDQYPSPKALANYLHHLIAHPEEYLSYLQWRETMEIVPLTNGGWTNFLCPLCQIAHQRTSLSHPSSRLNFSTWFHPKHQCHRDDLDLFHKCKQTKLNIWMSLVHHVRCP